MTTLDALAAVPESRLAEAVAARLPADGPPAPWRTRLEAIVWVHRASEAAVDQLPAALRARRLLPVTVGAFVRYLDTPVGPYGEVFGSPVLLLDRRGPLLSVPFMAVDSLASIHGGRTNWDLPKTLAAFGWSGREAVRAEGDGWTATADARGGPGLWLPFRTSGRTVQLSPADGRPRTTTMRSHGLARPTTVTVTSEGPTLPAWLREGRHPGAALRRTTMVFGPPR